MREERTNLLVGLLLIVGGTLLLLVNLNVIPVGLTWLWAGLSGFAGLGFWFHYLTHHAHWWPVIPGMSLLGLSAAHILKALFFVPGEWGGAIFLVALSSAFWTIYLVTGSREWWAIIPGGVLLAVAATTGLSTLLPGDADAGLLMLGIALTFVLVYLLPSPGARKRWALIPAGALVVIGLALAASAVAALRYLWPVALILAGVYAILRAFRRE